MADAQQLADEETRVRAWAASRNISADTCDVVVVALGFSSLEALSCLEAGDLKKTQVPIGQQNLLLRCVAKQLPTSNTVVRGPTCLISFSEMHSVSTVTVTRRRFLDVYPLLMR